MQPKEIQIIDSCFSFHKSPLVSFAEQVLEVSFEHWDIFASVTNDWLEFCQVFEDVEVSVGVEVDVGQGEEHCLGEGGVDLFYEFFVEFF